VAQTASTAPSVGHSRGGGIDRKARMVSALIPGGPGSTNDPTLRENRKGGVIRVTDRQSEWAKSQQESPSCRVSLQPAQP
jgi:hypothetical protein